jgi:hypothetical protein
MSEEPLKEFEQERKNRVEMQKINGPVIDRYSIVFTAIIAAVVLFFLLNEKNRKWAAFFGAAGFAALGYTASRPARIRKNEFEGEMFFKGENDCGFTSTIKHEIDGIMIRKYQGGFIHHRNEIYKASNGTDIVIDINGNVSPAGFGSRLMQKLNRAGYLPSAPDECWLEVNQQLR